MTGDAAATALTLARGGQAALELHRQRIDDLNVYPVPDGDTGSNLLDTAIALTDGLAELGDDAGREEIARAATRSALMGARGNSGVILCQIVRGFAESLGAEPAAIDGRAVARAAAGGLGERVPRRPPAGRGDDADRRPRDGRGGRGRSRSAAAGAARPHAGGRRPRRRAHPGAARSAPRRAAWSTPAPPGWSSSPGARSPPARRADHRAGVDLGRAPARASRRCTPSPRATATAPRSWSRATGSTPPAWSASWMPSATRCWWWASRRRSRCTSIPTIRRRRALAGRGDGRRRPGRDRRHAHARRPSANGACGWSPTRPATAVVAIVAGEGNEAGVPRGRGARMVAGGQSMNPSAGEIAQAIAAARRGGRRSCCRTTAT